MENLLTQSGVAYLLRTTPARVSRWAKTAGLPAVVLPDGALRFQRSEVMQWVQSRKQQTGTEHNKN